MEEGRKFNTNYPTNKPSSFIHYPLSHKKVRKVSSGFFCAHAEKVSVFVLVFVFYYYLCTRKQYNSKQYEYCNDECKSEYVYANHAKI